MKIQAYFLLYSLSILSFNSSAEIQAFGHYTAGCIPDAPALAKEGQGYHVIRLNRERYYGHPALITSIEKLSINMQNYGKDLLIGDMSQANGGKMPTGHRSHQMGLDADIMLAGWDKNKPLSDSQRQNIQPVSLLTKDKKQLDHKRFKPWHLQLLKQASQQPEVARIFINPLIKAELCKQNPKAAWLQKIRPWWGHDGHLHIRLTCPDKNPECHNQAPPPKGTGCDSTLAWWVNKLQNPAKTTSTTNKPANKPKPQYPAICQP